MLVGLSRILLTLTMMGSSGSAWADSDSRVSKGMFSGESSNRIYQAQASGLDSAIVVPSSFGNGVENTGHARLSSENDSSKNSLLAAGAIGIIGIGGGYAGAKIYTDLTGSKYIGDVLTGMLLGWVGASLIVWGAVEAFGLD